MPLKVESAFEAMIVVVFKDVYKYIHSQVHGCFLCMFPELPCHNGTCFGRPVLGLKCGSPRCVSLHVASGNHHWCHPKAAGLHVWCCECDMAPIASHWIYVAEDPPEDQRLTNLGFKAERLRWHTCQHIGSCQQARRADYRLCVSNATKRSVA